MTTTTRTKAKPTKWTEVRGKTGPDKWDTIKTLAEKTDHSPMEYLVHLLLEEPALFDRRKPIMNGAGEGGQHYEEMVLVSAENFTVNRFIVGPASGDRAEFPTLDAALQVCAGLERVTLNASAGTHSVCLDRKHWQYYRTFLAAVKRRDQLLGRAKL